MRRLLGALIILAGCSKSGVAPLAFFSAPSTRPLVAIAEVSDQPHTSLSKESARVILSEVTTRLEQKNRVAIGEKMPQFSVRMELVKHSATQSPSPELNILIHLEILDLRDEKPKVILQEVLGACAPIERNSAPQVDWTDAAFRVSPLGLSHRKLSREIASRIEDYVLIAGRGGLQ